MNTSDLHSQERGNSVKKFIYRSGLIIFIVFGLFTQVFAQRPDSSAVTELLSAGSTTVTVGSVLLNETFDSTDAWEAFQADHSSAKVVKGVYRMNLTGNIYTYGLNQDTHTDVVIQAETLQNSSVDNNSYGVICRADTDGAGYYFQISGDGYYSIEKGDSKGLSSLVDWAQSDAINQGQNRNHITAVCVGDYLALYVNDKLLAETNDDTLTEGVAGFTVGAYDDNDEIDISFDNTVIWEASSSGGSGSHSAVTLKEFDGKSEDAISELEDIGAIPSGSVFIFGEDYAFFNGKGSFFTPLASKSPHKNIVLAGKLKFTVGDPDKFESCVLTSRIKTNSRGDAVTYIDTGFINDGTAFIYDRFSESADPNFQVSDTKYDLGDQHHILLTLIDDKANLYVDGKLEIADFTVDERSGSYGISLTGEGSKAKCEGRDLWAYSLPS